VIVAYRVPPYLDPAFQVTELGASILGIGRASRLYRTLVRERRLAKDVVTYAFPLVTGAAMLLAWATGYENVSTEALEAALCEEVSALGRVEEAELQRALAVAEIRLVEEIERVASRADLFSMFESHFGDAARLNSELDRLRRVRVGQIRAFADEYLGEDNRAILTYEPTGSGGARGSRPTQSAT
jgi:zinc protease